MASRRCQREHTAAEQMQQSAYETFRELRDRWPPVAASRALQAENAATAGRYAAQRGDCVGARENLTIARGLLVAARRFSRDAGKDRPRRPQRGEPR